MNKAHSKYFNTAMRMDEALLSLLEKKDFKYITVKEICDEAQVNRSTFYLHYETIGDLLDETIDYIMSKLTRKFDGVVAFENKSIGAVSREELMFITPKYLIPYLEFVKENRKCYSVIVTQPSVLRVNDTFNKQYAEIFAPIMRRFGIGERESRYCLAFYLNGMFSVITEWIKNDCEDSIDYIAELIISCIPSIDNLTL